MTKRIIVIGAGGHATVVADALLRSDHEVLGFTDVNASANAKPILGLPVLGTDEVLARYSPNDVLLANGIGGTRACVARQGSQARLEGRGWRFATVVHPDATIAHSAVIAEAAQVFARAVVQPEARIGIGAIVNTAAVIEHHSEIGAWVHVAPGAIICGACRIGEGSHVGAGAVVRQGTKIGSGSTIGAGAVVIVKEDVPAGSTLLGVPALARGEGRA